MARAKEFVFEMTILIVCIFVTLILISTMDEVDNFFQSKQTFSILKGATDG